MKAYRNLRFAGFLLFISGLLGFILGLTDPSHSSILSPVILAMGAIFTMAGICGNKKHYNRNLYMIIVAAALAVMLVGEYIFAPAQNRLPFFILLVILAAALSGMSYFILTPEKSYTRQKKILSWIITILFSVAFYGLMAIIYNNFIMVLALGVLIIVLVVVSTLIRRRRIQKAQN